MIKPLSVLRNKSSSWHQMVRRGRSVDYATFVDTYARTLSGPSLGRLWTVSQYAKHFASEANGIFRSSVRRWRFRRVGSWSGEMFYRWPETTQADHGCPPV